ncbi:TIR domain-containing protein [Edaphobacter modestus]|uniref:Cyclic nucleotide-binding protein n=1 Tax=Edaphobacter modestus TaxID=388466 RepID=A0A4Q7YR70_9BACT|nr:TIR domain-containing protein [Edaphobacter modestus]RZU39305.1 cyclic nucleotide-binding protein [Edaphobacter modestus]
MLVDRFVGADGKRLLLEALRDQRMVTGDAALAEKLSEIRPIGIAVGNSIIEQGTTTNSLFLIIAGRFNIIVNGRVVAQRSAGDSVGEMSAISPTQRRSASVTASEESVVLEITEPQFSKLTSEHPGICKVIAKELARRLEQRNSLVTTTRDRLQVFIISSVEALPIARAIQNAFARDPFNVNVWTDGVFKASTYTIPALEQAVDQSDFALAIVQPDDTVTSRGEHDVPVARDNVIFELGLFIGRLGLPRTFLVEPWDVDVRLPSDFAGVTPVGYKLNKDDMANAQRVAGAMGPACNQMRDYMNSMGPR